MWNKLSNSGKREQDSSWNSSVDWKMKFKLPLIPKRLLKSFRIFFFFAKIFGLMIYKGTEWREKKLTYLSPNGILMENGWGNPVLRPSASKESVSPASAWARTMNRFENSLLPSSTDIEWHLDFLGWRERESSGSLRPLPKLGNR